MNKIARQKKIILIEDNSSIVEILELLLKESGFDIIIATSGEEGLKKVKQESPDLIILDLMLPGLPGEEVCRQIRKDEKLGSIPIIMLTAKSLDVDEVVGMVIGANYYMTKPFDVDELLEKIGKLIGIEK